MKDRPSNHASVEFDPAVVDRIVAEHGTGRDKVIPILHDVQRAFNYLPEPALRRLCECTEITPADVSGIATFYSQFRLRPAGRHFIKVCVGTACHVKGAQAVYDAFRRHLKIPDGSDTDPEHRFTLEKVACLGCCMLAPAVQIDDTTYGYVDPHRVENVLADFLAGRDLAQRRRAPAPKISPAGEVRICTCTSCAAGGSRDVLGRIEEEIADLRLPVRAKTVGCTGLSFETPMVDVATADGGLFRYGRVAPDDVRALLLRHFHPTNPLRRVAGHASLWLEKILTDEAWAPVTRYRRDVRPDRTPLEAGQHRLATEHAGEIDPLDFDAYGATGGFEAVRRCGGEFSEEDILRTIEDSKLRGRGGAGYPTARKWRFVRDAGGEGGKVLICNGDEGDPGAFMDRMIMESFPFRVLEGMMIAAFCTGAAEGVAYVRSEYPLAVERMGKAVEQCRSRELLGPDVFGAGRGFDVRIVEGAGAFVCGEETALIASLEGRRGTPRYRPPYPAESGWRGRPTLINNVETFALTPWIVRHGAAAFAALGTEGSRGTKTFALAGKVRRGGLIEVPMGMTLRDVVERVGGGIEADGRLKAVQVGGPSGSCVPEHLCDIPIDYEDLAKVGGIMGSGGLVALDEEDCMVDIARYFMEFTAAESCGKCTFCRIGTRRMLEVLERLCRGEGKAGDIEEVEHLAAVIHRGSLCGLGRTAPNPVLSTLRYFRDEYEAHVEGWCPAGRCTDLIRYEIGEACIGCTRCAQNCPVDAIAFRPYERHEIDTEICTRSHTCREVCPVAAVSVVSGGRIVKSGRR